MPDNTSNTRRFTEAERLDALYRYEILDTPFEAEFDDIVKIAAHVCDAPVALISLVDVGRQWFKSAIGVDIRETPIEQSICSFGMREGDVFVIPDTTKDERTRSNPLVTSAPDVRFYAGAPIVAPDGQPLGMVCVLDKKPRVLTVEQTQTLRSLSRQVMMLLEMKMAIRVKQANEKELHAALAVSKSQNAKLKILTRISDILVQTDHTKDILNAIFLEMTQELGADFYFNYMPDEAVDERLVLQSSTGLSDEQKRSFRFLSYDESICGAIAKNRKPYIMENLQARDDHWTAAARKLGINAYAGHPLIANGVLLGTLSFGSSQRPKFLDNELELIKTVTDQISASMDRARLLRELTLREADLRVLLEKAESANIAKTDFLANMSHEIRTPMNAVVGLTHILQMTSPLSPKQKECLSTLKLSADSLLKLINDMLDVAKIEARTMDLEAIPFNLTHVVEDVMNIMALRAKEKKLDFILENSFSEHAIFIGDPSRIKQILMNLCSNAIKFTSTGMISIKLESYTLTHDANTISISVTDTGIGIPDDKLDVIFEKFIQADSTINRKYGGTGLGLAIIKTLTDAMGGAIVVTSDVGKGSTFTVRLPLKKAMALTIVDAADGALRDVQRSDAPRLRVLLVDDYAPNILVAGTFLERFGFDFDVAQDGEAALIRLEQEEYALVLMDVQMHGLNGLAATERIRAKERGTIKHIPIIGMTAHAMGGDRERCLAAGMDDYISKPFNPDELEEKLDVIRLAIQTKITNSARSAAAP